MRPVFVLAMLSLLLFGSLGVAMPARAAPPAKVAIIVGPVGEELTPVYIALAEAAAVAAEAGGATVARAYSPDATAEKVIDAVADASIVVYFGHGIGTPNPYSSASSPETANGWGLNGPGAVGTHADSFRDGTLAYYGEAWIARHARPAPGWVVIYSNACYAPGASEGFDTAATEDVAAQRVSAYSRAPLADMGASAYFATDFFEGAAHLVSALLAEPARPYGEIFASDPRYVAEGLTRRDHDVVAGAETWLHRSPYFEGRIDYWYAFAGNPAASLGGTIGKVPTAAAASAPANEEASGDIVTGRASSYGESVGWEGMATVALPLDMGGGFADGEPRQVMICADRCVLLPIVDSCPCYAGTPDERVANLSHAAWALVSDAPLEEGLIEVLVYLEPSLGADAAPDGGVSSPTR